MLYYLLFTLSISNNGSNYIRSLFGHPGTNEVENEWVDGIEILQNDLTIPNRKHIKDSFLVTTIIPDESYPFPGHNYDTTYWSQIKSETEAIKNYYNNKVDLIQENLFWHPAAAKNYFTTQDELDKAQRVKIKFTIQPTYTRHILPAFFPPGELVTVEIPEAVKNEISITLNQQCRTIGGDPPQYEQRLNNLQIAFRLTQTINTIGSPYGGTCTITCTTSEPIDIIFSGVILQPYFYYGMNSDDEWENDLSKRPGPYVYLDTGNFAFLSPSYLVRNSNRMNDCMKYWRSAVQISQTTANDYLNSQFGRIHNPCIGYFDSYVPFGAACAIPAANLIHFSPSWLPMVITYDSSIDNPWGIIHEINHLHQKNWAKTSQTGEISCNAISLVAYAKMNMVSASRMTTGWGRYTYASYNLNNQDEYALGRYSNILHFFGVDSFKKFVYSDQNDLYFSRNNYGNAGSEMLRASIACNRDMHYHWNFHGTTDEELNNSKGDTFAELKKLNLKPFHPVTNIYSVGQVVDGKDIITARPYGINPTEQVIDFVSTMVQRNNKEEFGDFKYQSILFEKGRRWAWKKVKDGVYKLTPKTGLTDIEEVRVNYYDETTGETHTVICQFTTMYFSKGYSKLTQYGYIPDSENDIIKAYRYIVKNGSNNNILNEKYDKYSIHINGNRNKSINISISVLEGCIKPSETGNYVFSAITSNSALFYLSENPLKNDPDLDFDKLINYQPDSNTDYERTNKSKIMQLDSNKSYYFKLIYLSNPNKLDGGYAEIGYKFNNNDIFSTIPSVWTTIKPLTENDEKELFDNQFEPDFERIYGMDVWTGKHIKDNSQSKWNVYKYPVGDCYNFTFSEGTILNSTITQIITDNDNNTVYHAIAKNDISSFPHIFEIDMGSEQSFNIIILKGNGVIRQYPMKSNVKIYVAPSNYTLESIPIEDENDNETQEFPYDNYSLNHNESLVWEGVFNSRTQDHIDLEKEVKGRYMRIIFFDNSEYWFKGNAGTSIARIEVGLTIKAKKIYPITNTKYLTFKNKWDEYRGGAYYNGKGITGYAKGEAPKKGDDNSNNENSILSIKIPRSKTEFGIIGDYYPEMGSAIVKIDNEEIGLIGPNNSFDLKNDLIKLKKAKRSYKSLIFYYDLIDPNENHIMTVEVTKGQITLAGILTQQMIVDYFNDNGTYEEIIEHEFDELEDFNETIEPIPTPSFVEPIPDPIENLKIENIESEYSLFEFTDNGFKTSNDVDHNEIIIDKTTSTMKTITFSENEIKITESGNFNSSIPVYFIPTAFGSIIEIDKNLINSNIGIVARRKPQIRAYKSDIPISIMNNVVAGHITLRISETDKDNNPIIHVNLKEANCYMGDLTLFVPKSIENISFSTISLFKESSLKISGYDNVENQRRAKIDYIKEDDFILISKNLLNIGSNSTSTLRGIQIHIHGTLAVHDDSSLTLDSNSKFFNNSEIKLIVHKHEFYNDNKKPIIYFENSLDSIPSLIVLVSEKENEPIDIVNLPVIGSKNFSQCEKLVSRIIFENGKKGDISATCNETGGITYLIVDAEEAKNPVSKKKKQNTALIAGIASAAAVVVIVVIVVVVVILIKRKNNTQKSDDESHQILQVQNNSLL